MILEKRLAGCKAIRHGRRGAILGVDPRKHLDDRDQRGLSAAVRRIEGTDGDRDLSKCRCTMKDRSGRHQIDDRRWQFALKLINIDRGIEQER